MSSPIVINCDCRVAPRPVTTPVKTKLLLAKRVKTIINILYTLVKTMTPSLRSASPSGLGLCRRALSALRCDLFEPGVGTLCSLMNTSCRKNIHSLVT